MNIILHFGMHKTGSSSIQESLYRHLSDENFYYVSANQASNQSGCLITAFFENPSQHHLHRARNLSIEELSTLKNSFRLRLAQELSCADNKTALISAEAISNMDKVVLIALKQFLLQDIGLKADLQLVGYIRTPKEFMESAFQQKVKEGLNQFNLMALFPKYQDRFQRLDDVFGSNNIQYWKYNPKNFPAKDVVMDFCTRLGIKFDAEKSIRSNESISLSALKLLYTYHKYGYGYGVGKSVVKENGRLIQKLSIIPGSKIRFHSDLVRPILENYAAQIAWMEERLSAPLIEDISKDDDIAICREEDLFNIDDETSQWLAQQLGKDYENRWHEKLSVQEIASWMHDFREKLSSQAQNTKPSST